MPFHLKFAVFQEKMCTQGHGETPVTGHSLHMSQRNRSTNWKGAAFGVTSAASTTRNEISRTWVATRYWTSYTAQCTIFMKVNVKLFRTYIFRPYDTNTDKGFSFSGISGYVFGWVASTQTKTQRPISKYPNPQKQRGKNLKPLNKKELFTIRVSLQAPK
jgi:hypothetical protein